jgi:hypothetical protein
MTIGNNITSNSTTKHQEWQSLETTNAWVTGLSP